MAKITQIIVEGMSGEQYTAKTYEGIVTEMRASAWGGDASDGIKGYMKQVAKRVQDWSGETICVTDAQRFLEDLAQRSLIRIAVKEEE